MSADPLAAAAAEPPMEARLISLVDDPRTVREAVRAWMTLGRPGPKVSNDMTDIVDMMLATGSRIGEVPALRWTDVDLDGERPSLTISGTVKTEPGRGSYRKASPKSDASRRTIVLPPFAVVVLRRRLQSRAATVEGVFATRNGTWHQVANVERRWRQIRKDTGLEWVTPTSSVKPWPTRPAAALRRRLGPVPPRHVDQRAHRILSEFSVNKPL